MSGGGGAGGAGAGAVVRQGYLRKLKTMKRKYFVLRAEGPGCSARLEYYESEKKFRTGAAPRRALPLPTCYNITRRLDLKQRHVIALFTKEEQFCVVAEGEEDLHGWLTDILKQHQSEDASEELLHPTQHVWQVNVQKKGLGVTKNIIGLYNLCLTDKTLTLVKIKANNMVIGELGIPERIEFSLKNIRRCGDSECFFYMEVGRQTATGSGELWMHTDDANIAQSMHSTILYAMTNCGDDKDMLPYRLRSSSATEDPRNSSLPARRQTYSDSRGRAGLSPNDKVFCVGSCIKQCVCATTSYSIDESAAAIAPLAPKNADENQPINMQITDKTDSVRHIKHHRTVSLPTGCPLFQEPLKIVHERTRSAPLTGDEVDCAISEKAARHFSCKIVNGLDFSRKSQWPRRASTGTKLSKLSPKNVPAIRSRCDSMPSRTCPPLEPERTPSRPAGQIGSEISNDETDASADWHRTPRIPEEPDYCEMNPRDLANARHSRQSSLAAEEVAGYLPMLPALSASSGSVSGTPSTDPRFSEYNLEPATSHLLEEEGRPPRAYSVGSRPAPPQPPRLRAYSVGAPRKQARGAAPPAPPRHNSSSAPLLPRASADDLMELDFSNNSPKTKVTVMARTPPTTTYIPAKPRPKIDEYVDMSPRAGYMEMRPSDPPRAPPVVAPTTPAGPLAPPVATTPDGYVEMNYGKKTEPTLPIAIASAPRRASPASHSLDTPAQTPDEIKKKNSRTLTPLGSQTIFPLSLESPASEEKDLQPTDVFDEDTPHHPLTTLREISEEGRKSPEVGSPPHYITLARTVSQPIAAPNKLPSEEGDELSCNPTATKTWAGDKGPEKSPPAQGEAPRLHYADLNLEKTGNRAPQVPRLYTQIDFNRSEKLNAADST